MQTHIRPRRDFTAMEQRRKRAARLFAAGRVILAAIARELRVSRQSVSRWYRQWKRGGSGALRGAGRAGRKAKLDRQQLRSLDGELRKGARAHGFSTDLWTLPRVAAVIERLTGVHYHPGHVWKILGMMDWTLQRPAKRAREQNPKAVKHWVENRWPEVKKTLVGEKLGFSSRMKVGSHNVPRSAGLGRRRGKPPS